MPALSKRSLAQLATCAQPLRRLVNDVAEEFPCEVLEGARRPARQVQLVREGKSRTLESKHVVGPAMLDAAAVDVAPLPIDWRDTHRFYAFGGYVKARARALGIRIRWGGDWDGDWDLADQDFNDLVHFELV